MSTNEQKPFLNALKTQKETEWPWNLFPNQQIPFHSKYSYEARTNTIQPTVRLYYPLVRAATAYSLGDDNCEYRQHIPPYALIIRGNRKSLATVVEAEAESGERILVAATRQGLYCTAIATDGTPHAANTYSDMAQGTTPDGRDYLFALSMALIPFILSEDVDHWKGVLSPYLDTLAAHIKTAVSSSPSTATPGLWMSIDDVPDAFFEAAYFMDGAYSILSDSSFIPYSASGSASPWDLNLDKPFSGALISQNLRGGWTPKHLQINGKRQAVPKATLTIQSARSIYGVYSQGRVWTAQEKRLIPKLPENMPVMPEVVKIAQRIIDTENDANPVVNIMWRAGTGYGKTTGVQQLAAILDMPLLKFTCDPSTETQDFKSQFVPAGSDESESILLDREHFQPGAEAESEASSLRLRAALDHYHSLDSDGKAELMNASEFYGLALMDTDAATGMLLGNQENIPLDELCGLYTEFYTAVKELPVKAKLAEMSAVASQEKPKDKPDFIHVISPYLKAMVNGYLVEIQEASRIRSSGVLVGLNNFDLPGSVMPLMNGAFATRHSKAICCYTDNTGYESCRNIDPSVLRRMGMVIDSAELSKERLFARATANTGVDDQDILETCYRAWTCVKDYCAHNGITEGYVSPVEFERLVQATKYDGITMLPENLDDCVISKASSKAEDQKDIREAYATLQ